MFKIVEKCPDKSDLIELVEGRLNADRAEALETHIERCDRCGATLASLTDSEDSVLRAVQACDAEFANEPELRAITAGLKRDGFASARAAAEPPQVLDQYRLIEQIGSGGMGVVYLAEHVHLRTRVALKVISPHRVHDEHALDRFWQEIAAAGRLGDHEHIVRAFDAGEADGYQFLAMEFVEGLDLAKLVGRLERVPLADAAAITRQAAQGLAHAHRRGIVHRDVKPSNLMLTDSGRVKVLDLGLALFVRELKEVTRPSIAGSRAYMAPEQAAGVAVDSRVDVYSLALTFLTLLLGRPPQVTFSADRAKRAKQLQELYPGFDAPLAEMLVQALAPKSAERLASVRELAEALAPVALHADLVRLVGRARGPFGDTDARIADTTLTMAPSLPAPIRRNWLPWLAYSGLAISIAVIIGLLMTRDRATPAQRLTRREATKAPPEHGELGLHDFTDPGSNGNDYELTGQTPRFAVLGEATLPNFVLEADLTLETAGRHAGLIFGLRRGETNAWKSHSFVFTAAPQYQRPETLLIDIREVGIAENGGEYNLNVSTAMVHEFDWKKPHRWGVSVDPDGQAQIELDGKIVPRSDWIGKNEKLPENWWKGNLGVFLIGPESPAKFRNVVLKAR